MNMKKLVVASHNAGKIREIKSMLEPFQVEVVSAAELDLPDVEETGSTFEENARLKSEALAKESGCYALGDDSGLCVNCLSGRPGVYSARYAPNRDFDKGMDMLLEEISESGAKDRSAYFACVLALTSPAGETRIFEGRNGFGYDPIFIPDGFDKTFANFDKEEKNRISHRGRAFQKMIEEVFC